ncbi:MAG: hypothetical protein HOO66_01395 [Nitrosarchaeum sp.]|nr:hypothetical protein [Nitrosarchaeum sp.]
MEKIQLYTFYTFGWDYHMLISDRHYENVKSAKEFLDKNIGFINKSGLDVTAQVIKSEKSKSLKNLYLQKNDEAVSEVSVKEIIDFAIAIEKTVDAELRLKHSFVLTNKRLDLTKLLDNVGALFGDGVFNRMSYLSQKDFQEAGKCVAFEMPTAAAFHILRATEETLRQFYRKKIPKKNHNSVLLWKPMIEQMRTNPKLRSYKTLLDSYDNIRFNFRNPTSHPDMFYTLDTVQDLFLLCIEANSRVINALKD